MAVLNIFIWACQCYMVSTRYRKNGSVKWQAKNGTGKNGTNGTLVKMAHWGKSILYNIFKEFFQFFMKYEVY